MLNMTQHQSYCDDIFCHVILKCLLYEYYESEVADLRVITEFLLLGALYKRSRGTLRS